MLLYNLTTLSVGFSLFITFLLLWLGVMVLLASSPDRWFALLAGVGLLLGAAFFVSHGMIVGRGPTGGGSGMEFWWRLGWVPAITAPLIWYATVLRYAGLDAKRRNRLHIPLLIGLSILGIVVLVMLVTNNPFSTYSDLRANAAQVEKTPLVIQLYVILAILCFTLPIIALFVGRTEEIAPVHRGSRIWLAGTGILMQIAVIIVGRLAGWAIRNAIPLLNQDQGTMQVIFVFDVLVLILIGGSIILLGRAVVAHEVFTERPLPHQGAIRRWYGVIIASAACATLISLAHARQIVPLYSLTTLGGLAITTYALFTWQAFSSQEQFVGRLLPFVTSLSLPERLLGVGKTTQDFSAEAERLLAALCIVIDAPAALLTFARRPKDIRYHWTGPPPTGKAANAIQVPLTSSTTSGELWLARKNMGDVYTAEEIALAHACGERLLDAIAGEEIAVALLDLLRRRLTEFNVITARHKRVIHDDVLPDLHLALLNLPPTDQSSEATTALTRAHHTLSELLRNTPHTPSLDLERQGMRQALHRTLEHDFVDQFDSVHWNWDADADSHLRALPDLAREVLYYATLEAIRNAARYAGQPDALPSLTVSLHNSAPPNTTNGTANDTGRLTLTVRDNGPGIPTPNTPGKTKADTTPQPPNGISAGTGQGLLLHTTMMAVVAHGECQAAGGGVVGAAVGGDWWGAIVQANGQAG